jgi:hypothetical protein
MADKSTLPPSQDEKKFEQDAPKAGGRPQENKGYQEDQPGHPVRTTGSTRPDQESHLSSRETGPGCDIDKPEE